MVPSTHGDDGPYIVSGRSLLSCNHEPLHGVWFSIVQTARGVRIFVGDGADGEPRMVESNHPAAMAFISSLILQLRAVAA